MPNSDRPQHLQPVPDEGPIPNIKPTRHNRVAEAKKGEPNYMKRQTIAAAAMLGTVVAIYGGVKFGQNIVSGDKATGPAPVEKVVDALNQVPVEQVVPVDINTGDGINEIIEHAMPQAHTNETLMNAEREIVSKELGMPSPDSIVPGGVASVEVPTVQQDPETHKIVPPIQ